MVPLPPSGRIFSGERRVRLGDVDPSARLRLDALTRYTQDVSNDDTTDAGLHDDLAWVVRKTTVEVFTNAAFGEDLVIQTFCGGLGRRWAERRLTVRGRAGAHYEVATLWVQVDAATGRPKKLSDQFIEIYGEAAQGREVGARQTHPSPPDAVHSRPWPLRVVDFDTLDHMNNAAYWAVVEESLAEHPLTPPLRASIEYGGGIAPGSTVTIDEAVLAGVRHLWWRVEGQALASASLAPIVGVSGTVSASPS